jgi:hypothetical protein
MTTGHEEKKMFQKLPENDFIIRRSITLLRKDPKLIDYILATKIWQESSI